MIKLNGKAIDFKAYPNGETLIPILKPDDQNGTAWRYPLVTFIYEDDRDITRLFFISKYLDDLGWGTMKELIIPYVPYSRMDRSENNSPFSLRFFADLVNSMNWIRVLIGECHSEVTMALFRNAKEKMFTPFLLNKFMDDQKLKQDQVWLYYPDAGAEKRYAKLFPGYKYSVGRKVRDFETGQIRKITVANPPGNRPRHVVMIDDLCSFGGTFIGGADNFWPGELYPTDIPFSLLVAHCEASILKGRIVEDPRFAYVYTTDSMGLLEHPKIVQIKAPI